MDFFWLFDLGNFWLFVLIVSFITFGGLTKTLFFPNFFDNLLYLDKKFNDFVLGFLSLTGAFLSITIGLIIVGTYENFEQSEEITRNEASTIFSLHKSIEFLGGADKEVMLTDIKNYVSHIIVEDWPQQKLRILPLLKNQYINAFEAKLKAYQPISEKDLVLYREAVKDYDEVLTIKEERISNVLEGLPGTIYIVLIIGLLINILISWQIEIHNRKLEIFTYSLTGLLAGCLVFIIIAMDYPFIGVYGVSTEPYELLLSNLK